MKTIRNIIITSFLLAQYLLATQVQVLNSDSVSFFDSASYQGTMLTEDNSLKLAPIIDKIDVIKDKHVWKLYQATDNTMYAATAKNGAVIYKLSNGDTNFKPFISNNTHTAYTSIIVDTTGNIYVALGPEAILQKYDNTGKLLWEKDIDNIYIWDMKFDKAGNLYVATGGDNASVLLVSKDGDIKEIFKIDETHIVAMYYNETKNSMYMGTAGDGLLLELNLEDYTYTIVYDTDENEVHAITMDKLGNIYFGTSTRETPSITLPTKIDTQVKDIQSRSFRNSLYRVDSKGTVQRLFYLNQIVVFALSSDNNNNVYFVTGDSTDIYRIDNKTGALGYIGGLKDKTLSTFTVDNNGSLIFAMSGTGEIYKMQNVIPRTGQFTSKAIDLKLMSRFGSFGYMTSSSNATVKIETRTGNRSEIDSTWSDFETISENGGIKSRRARFIQFRITLSTDTKTINPQINNLYFSYATDNIAPDILSLSLVTYNRQQKTQKDSEKRPQLSSSDAMLIWSATDQNGDTLTYDLFYRMKGESAYRTMASNITKNSFTFNANKIPSGIYDFKLIASDKADNPLEESLSREFEALNVVFDNVAPVVDIVDNVVITKNVDNTATIKFRVYDELSIIRSVRYSTSFDDSYLFARSDDGLIDSKEEFITINITDKNASAIAIEVVDIEGNTRYYSYVIK